MRLVRPEHRPTLPALGPRGGRRLAPRRLLPFLAVTLVILAGLVGDRAAVPRAVSAGRPTGAVAQAIAPGSPNRSDASSELFGERAASLEEAEVARRNGDHDGAAAILRLLVSQGASPTASEALLQLAVVLVEGGHGAEAVDAARELLRREADPAGRSRAAFVLGRAQRAAGECAGALASFAEAQRLGSGLGAYVDLQMADCHARLGDRAGQDSRAQRALAQTTARQARLDALEHRADAAHKRGDRAAALIASEQLLAQAGTRAYRAKTLTSIATINVGGGRRDEAIRAYATVVAELPETASAPEALQGLTALDGLGAVGPDHVGAVHHHHGRHREAAIWLGTGIDQGLTPERLAPALYLQGGSLLRLERLPEGVAALRRLASEMPGAEVAPVALVRAGRALESSGRLNEAAELYRQAADAHAATRSGQEAHSRLVVALYRRGMPPEAIAAARELAAGGAETRWKGLGLFWAGKAFARAGDAPQAAQTWRQAADLDPDDFGGLRSRALLLGEARPFNAARPLDPAVLRPSEDELGELDGWLGRLGVGAATLEAERLADPSYARAAELFRVGMREQARWELQEVGARVAADPARLYWLARYAADHGEPRLGIGWAVEARRATGEPLHALPRMVQRLILPLPYADLILAHAQERGVDPLLFAALVRQESTWDAAARSSANAVGLAQVIPSTGQGIASALGRGDYKTDDLLRPIVSVEFGMYYLASQLKGYGGQIYPAVAAYNAGGGAVNGWLREFGAEDVDLWADRIPYAETNHYVQVVYENYRLYHRLYGG